MIKTKIKRSGLRVRWIAEKIGINYNSLRVYLNNEDIMPENVKSDILRLLNKYK